MHRAALGTLDDWTISHENPPSLPPLPPFLTKRLWLSELCATGNEKTEPGCCSMDISRLVYSLTVMCDSDSLAASLSPYHLSFTSRTPPLID